MFADGASDPNRVDAIMYSHDSENFAEDATKLDTWVFDQFSELIKNTSSDPELYKKINDDQIVIFLHLLGLDTNGHAYGPHSEEYQNNIKVVDEGIRKTVKLIEGFYGNDGRTAYIFTADHGMSNRGNHGDGHPDNTRTPIIAWGAGIKKPNRTHPTGHDEFSKEWKLDNIQRNDILQADIAPLMSSLIGINYPVNSVGELPLIYLDNTPIFKVQSIFVNSKEILEQYKVKYEHKRQTELWFKPYPGLSNSTHNPELLIDQIQGLIDAEQYEKAESLCVILNKLSLEGLRYFQTYDWLMLRSFVTAGYVGWIMYSLKFTFKEYALDEEDNLVIEERVDPYKLYINAIAAISLVLFGGLLYAQKSPGTYYTYMIFPVYFWREVLLERNIFVDVIRLSLSHQSSISLLSYVIGYVVILEILVYSYFERGILSVCFVLLAFWPLFMKSKVQYENTLLFISWFVSCLVSSVFTLLPVEKGEDIILVIIGGILIILTGIITLRKSTIFEFESPGSKNVIGFQVIAWIILAISTATPFAYGLSTPKHYFQRLSTIILAFAPLFVLLSISYEVLFYYFLSITLVIWHQIEKLLYETEKLSGQGQSRGVRKLELRDSRVSLIFLFFIKVAFFGTGNVASLASFSLQSVYRLTTIFNPFLMGSLLLLKIIIPFFIVSSVFGIINKSLNLPPFGLFLLVLSTSDIMTLNFFYLVRDYGSWLEIGTTISHFVISSLFSLFLIILFLLSEVFVGKTLVNRGKDEEKEK
ncbi:685_t:CDS:10 [Acaulospora morrowiae]|uniref:GPI ethanolamine phosphate transferase 1 n=1 Tax=Acaulospora morrowiae TaxID=94023 RepID=A0A9N9DX84_9GLOM|nr:685_t:CDS:10 [Acaulospora morrowiae]